MFDESRILSGKKSENGLEQLSVDWSVLNGLTEHARTQDMSKAEQAMDVLASRMHYLAGYDSSLPFSWADTKTITQCLKGLNNEELKQVQISYQRIYKKSLEDDLADCFKGSDHDILLGLLKGKQASNAGDVNAGQVASSIHRCLIEKQEWTGRTNWQVEQDLRKTFSVLNAEQLARTCIEYKTLYGSELDADIAAHSNLAENLKVEMAIYLKGADKRTSADSLGLAGMALQNKDIDLFQQIMAQSTNEIRQRFVNEGGLSRIAESFSGSKYSHAISYAKYGKLDSALQIRENTGSLSLGFFSNREGIVSAIDKLTDEQRHMYLEGKVLAEEIGQNKQGNEALSENQRVAIEFYRNLHESMSQAVRPTELLGLEDRIAIKGGSVIYELSKGQGYFLNSRANELISSLNAMPEEKWTALRDYVNGTAAPPPQAAHPEYRGNLEKVLQGLSFFRIGAGEKQSILELFDRRMKGENTATKKTDAQESDNRPAVEKIRSNILAWGGQTNIMQMLHSLNKEKLVELRYEYAQKFGSDLQCDLVNKLSTQENTEVAQLFSRSENISAAYMQLKDDYLATRAGIGSSFADACGSGTGAQLDDSANGVSAELVNNSRKQNIIQEKIAQFKTDLQNHQESKATCAEYSSTAMISAVAVAGALQSGGASLGLLSNFVRLSSSTLGNAGICAGSATALQMTIMGNDYDWSLKQIAKSTGTGFVDGLIFGKLGGNEVGRLFGMGQKAAAQTAEKTALRLLKGESIFSRQAMFEYAKGTALSVTGATAAGGSTGVLHGLQDWDCKRTLAQNFDNMSRHVTGSAFSGGLVAAQMHPFVAGAHAFALRRYRVPGLVRAVMPEEAVPSLKRPTSTTSPADSTSIPQAGIPLNPKSDGLKLSRSSGEIVREARRVLGREAAESTDALFLELGKSKDLEMRQQSVEYIKAILFVERIPPEEIARTFNEFSELLKAPHTKLADDTRAQLATQILARIVEPQSADQSYYPTCLAAGISTQLFARCPSVAVRLIKEAISTGVITTNRGEKISIDVNDLQSDSLTRRASEIERGQFAEGESLHERGQADKILQSIIINSYWQTSTIDPYDKPCPLGSIRMKYTNDCGGLSVFGNNIKPTESPSIPFREMDVIYESLTGRNDWITLRHSDVPVNKPGELYFHSKQDFIDELTGVQPSKREPISAMISPYFGQFFEDSGRPLPGKCRGTHVITLMSGPEPINGDLRSYLANSWGPRRQHLPDNGRSMNFHDLFLNSVDVKSAIGLLKQEAFKNPKRLLEYYRALFTHTGIMEEYWQGMPESQVRLPRETNKDFMITPERYLKQLDWLIAKIEHEPEKFAHLSKAELGDVIDIAQGERAGLIEIVSSENQQRIQVNNASGKKS